MALLLPIAFDLSPLGALTLLAGIYYGAQYGSSTTAILINLPGEGSGVITAIDGHRMALEGRAGPALGVAALASLTAGLISILLVAILLEPLADLALRFGPADYAALMVLGTALSIVLGQGPVFAGWALVCTGGLIGLVGTDIAGGPPRYTFGIAELADGVGFVPLALGLFGIAETIRTLSQNIAVTGIQPIGSVWPLRRDLAEGALPTLRGSAIGSAIGLLPGGTTLLASMLALASERLCAGRSITATRVAGIAAPEAANNAAAQTSFVPLLALGLPVNPVMAVMAGAMMLHGIAPGAAVPHQNAELVWGLLASMFIGNLLLVILNLPLVGMWAAVVRVPFRWLAAVIVTMCIFAAFTWRNSIFDVWMMIIFGLLGCVLYIVRLSPVPLVLGFILGAPFEENLRRALILSRNDPTVLITEPLAASLLLAATGVVIFGALPIFGRLRRGELT
jgi:putative tricarboxylic transport membrane protein